MKKFVCTVCGYVHEGTEAPAECPICHKSAEVFKEVEEKAEAVKKFVCTVCGYVHEGTEAPAECPICHKPAEVFKEM